MTQHVDVIVVGAGAAGMMAAARAGQRGKRVVLIDHASTLAEKIRISGGGRCNFTNLYTGPANYISANPHFCRSALARYTPQDFIKLVREHRIDFHEKHKGQLFCDDSSQRIINMLLDECRSARVSIWHPCKVEKIVKEGDNFLLGTDQGAVTCSSLIIATGGMSIPKIGATDFGLRIAKQFGLPIIEPHPALVPLTFDVQKWQAFVALAGTSLEVHIRCEDGSFEEDLLFTHRGLSGPAVLQISSYWHKGAALEINLLPQINIEEALLNAKHQSKQYLPALLNKFFSKRMSDAWVTIHQLGDRPIAEISDKTLRQFARQLSTWQLTPNGSEGYRKAEVMRGGVDTRSLDSKTMMAKSVSGLYFIGEVVDVTGWLGGYNFQWAWASGVAAGLAV